MFGHSLDSTVVQDFKVLPLSPLCLCLTLRGRQVAPRERAEGPLTIPRPGSQVLLHKESSVPWTFWPPRASLAVVQQVRQQLSGGVHVPSGAESEVGVPSQGLTAESSVVRGPWLQGGWQDRKPWRCFFLEGQEGPALHNLLAPLAERKAECIEHVGSGWGETRVTFSPCGRRRPWSRFCPC